MDFAHNQPVGMPIFDCHISGLVQIQFLCITKSESECSEPRQNQGHHVLERNNKFQQTEKEKMCTYFMLDNDPYSKLLNCVK
jgi:hypothetical protein